MANNIPEGWEKKTLGDIFSNEQLMKLTPFLNAKDKLGLRKYLTSIKEDLAKKDADDGFIYYVLCYNFNMI